MIKKVLLDTDIGGDIGDSLCLAYLLSNKECDLLGITTVCGNPIERAKVADAICNVANRNIPIYPGLDPKTPNGWYPTPEGEVKLPNWEHQNDFIENKAIDFMYKTIKNNPNEVYLIAIGSFSNVAELFKKYPDSQYLIKELIVMAGVFDEEINNSDDMPFMNWNVWADPISADIMFNSNVKIIKVYGLEITRKLTMTHKEINHYFNNPLLECVLDFGSEFLKTNIATFHDPLVATCLFNDKICEYERGTVKVDLKTTNEKQYGMTTFEKKNDGNCLLATKVDRDLFFKEFFNIVK